jgi:hypothetical protein
MQLEHSHMPLAKKQRQINCINEEKMQGYIQAQQSQVWREKIIRTNLLEMIFCDF